MNRKVEEYLLHIQNSAADVEKTTELLRSILKAQHSHFMWYKAIGTGAIKDLFEWSEKQDALVVAVREVAKWTARHKDALCNCGICQCHNIVDSMEKNDDMDSCKTQAAIVAVEGE